MRRIFSVPCLGWDGMTQHSGTCCFLRSTLAWLSPSGYSRSIGARLGKCLLHPQGILEDTGSSVREFSFWSWFISWPTQVRSSVGRMCAVTAECKCGVNGACARDWLPHQQFGESKMRDRGLFLMAFCFLQYLCVLFTFCCCKRSIKNKRDDPDELGRSISTAPACALGVPGVLFGEQNSWWCWYLKSSS